MIKVKATQKPAETGLGRSSFETGVEKASSLPAAFAMALVGLAIYLKGIVSSRAPEAAAEDAKRGPGEPEAASAPSGEAPVLRAVIERTEDEELVDDRAAGPEGDVIHLTSHAGFRARLMESFLPDPAPAIAMPPLPEAPGKPLSKVALEGDTIAFNDNARLSAALGGGGGGAASVQPGGGGGGSGSGSSGGERPEEHRRNRAPVVTGPVLLRDVKGCQAVFIPWAALLAGAVDPDGDLLRVLQVSASQGEVSVGAEGITYTPPEHGSGPVTLAFQVSDGEFSVAQLARFALVEADPIVGTEGNDSLVGTACGDLMDGAAGDDTIAGLAGADLILGGEGDDVIDAGAGSDTVLAGAGDDLVRAGAGDDLVWGGDGDDTLMGEAGRDVLMGEAGNDRLEGGEGDDQLFGGTGHDALMGDAGRDVLDGGEGDDRLDGGTGNDVLEGGAGSDSVAGGSGDDLVVGDLDAAADVLDGGEGRDVLDYGAAAQALDIDLASGRASGLEIGEDTIGGFEEVHAGAGADTIRFGHAVVAVAGGEGDDTFDFSALVPASAQALSMPAGSGTGSVDTGSVDTGSGDAGSQNAGSTPTTLADTGTGDTGSQDTGAQDTGAQDTGAQDTGTLAGILANLETAAQQSSQPLTVQQILDFAVGDRICMAGWTITIRGDDDSAYAKVRTDDGTELRLAIRQLDATVTEDTPFSIRIEEREGHEQTVVEVHFDSLADPDFMIALQGVHALQAFHG